MFNFVSCMSFCKNLFSLLENSIVINGNIYSSGSVDVQGKIEGVIIADVINVKEKGNIKGNIFANKILVSNGGSIDGDIVAKSIILLNGSHITGNVYYSSIAIEDGSIIDCNCKKMESNKISDKIKIESEKKGFLKQKTNNNNEENIKI